MLNLYIKQNVCRKLTQSKKFRLVHLIIKHIFLVGLKAATKNACGYEHVVSGKEAPETDTVINLNLQLLKTVCAT